MTSVVLILYRQASGNQMTRLWQLWHLAAKLELNIHLEFTDEAPHFSPPIFYFKMYHLVLLYSDVFRYVCVSMSEA